MLDLLKLAGILALIIVLLRLRWNLGLVLVLAAGLTGWLFGRPAGDLALDALGAAVDPLTLRLVAIVLLITFLGEILRSTLQLEGLIRSLTDLFTDPRWLLYTGPLRLPVGTTTIRARATRIGYLESEESAVTFTVKTPEQAGAGGE